MGSDERERALGETGLRWWSEDGRRWVLTHRLTRAQAEVVARLRRSESANVCVEYPDPDQPGPYPCGGCWACDIDREWHLGDREALLVALDEALERWPDLAGI